MKKKIGIVTRHLGYGGVEKSTADLASMLIDEYDVEIISVYNSDIAFKIDKKVKITRLMDTSLDNELLKQKYILTKYLKHNKYDYIISTRMMYNKVIGRCDSNIKIAIEHKYHNGNIRYIRKLINSVKDIDYFVPVSKELAFFYSDKMKSSVRYVPNCIDYYPKKRYRKKEKYLIAVGRLSEEKGFDNLIDVFKIVSNSFDDWKLVIVGDGEQRELLEKKIQDEDLTKKVTITGFLDKKSVNEYYKKASIYIMTSHEESFGTVSLEAGAFFVPTIAFSTAKGVVENVNKDSAVIIQGRDNELMASKIMELIKNNDKLNELAEEAYINSEKFTFENVKKQWEYFFKEMVENQKQETKEKKKIKNMKKRKSLDKKRKIKQMIK